MKEISILILTHNAPYYVEETINTLNEITDKNDLSKLEIIVLDNASSIETKNLLLKLKSKGYIHKLKFSDENTFFSKGNNLATKLAIDESKYYLLLNSDVSIKNKDWIKYLIKNKKKTNSVGISFGYASNPDRCDGYCFLIERELYDKYKLDEEYQWWWALTKFEANILKEGSNLCAIKFHDKYLHHYGGGSGKDFLKAQIGNTSKETILSWFNESKGHVFIKNLYWGYSFNRIIKKICQKSVKCH